MRARPALAVLAWSGDRSPIRGCTTTTGDQVPLGHEPFGHVRPDFGGSLYYSLAWLVRERQLELGVKLGFVCGVGVSDHSREVAERGDDSRDVDTAHLTTAGRRAGLGLGGYLLGLGLGDPRADHNFAAIAGRILATAPPRFAGRPLDGRVPSL